jgi:hypothetical protein
MVKQWCKTKSFHGRLYALRKTSTLSDLFPINVDDVCRLSYTKCLRSFAFEFGSDSRSTVPSYTEKVIMVDKNGDTGKSQFVPHRLLFPRRPFRNGILDRHFHTVFSGLSFCLVSTFIFPLYKMLFINRLKFSCFL